MPRIPEAINGVTVEFAPDVDNDIIPMLLDGLKHTISKEAAPNHTLLKIWVSSVRDSHSCPSRHVTGNAVDISRINGKRISETYGRDGDVTAIVNALQERFETYLPHRRENFGPFFKKKLGKPFRVGGHGDHFHFSVNGPHDCPRRGRVRRAFTWIRAKLRSRPEVCTDPIED